MLINLKKTKEELWEQIGNLRTDVRKGQKNEVYIEKNPSQDDILEAYKLYLRMMKKKFIPVNQGYTLYDNSHIETKIIVAKFQGKVISYIQFVTTSKIDMLGKAKICAFETIATDDDYKHLSPNAVLYWEGILFMKELGYEYLNFNGVSYEYGDSNLNSLAFFKRKWNGIEIQCLSEKSLFGYTYWRFFRRYALVRKMVYYGLIYLLPKSYLKY